VNDDDQQLGINLMQAGRQGTTQQTTATPRHKGKRTGREEEDTGTKRNVETTTMFRGWLVELNRTG